MNSAIKMGCNYSYFVVVMPSFDSFDDTNLLF